MIMAWQDIIFTVATDNPLIRTIPLIWLFIGHRLRPPLSSEAFAIDMRIKSLTTINT